MTEKTYTVMLGDSDRGRPGFVPNKITAHPGDTIIWKHCCCGPYDIVFDSVENPTRDASLAATMSIKKIIARPGQSATLKIPNDAPIGDYSFYCRVNRGYGMKGTLIIA
jgi:plastocyanin